MTTITTHDKEKERFNTILKYADKQGKAVFCKTETLEEQLQRELEYERELLQEIIQTQREVVFTMGAIGESRSKETGNHVKRVSEYSKLFALLYGFKTEEAELLKEASLMHDIGKVAIPDSILNKPSKLNKDEWTICKHMPNLDMIC
jgi:response regulator RpfG family c-di-GMP phosphodiesterase